MRRTRRNAPPPGQSLTIAFALVGAAAPYLALRLDVVPVRGYFLPSASMNPTMRVNDYFLSNQRPGPIECGDVVVFFPPEQVFRSGPPKRFIKRVVGLGGDRVAVRDGRVLVNGQPAPRFTIRARESFDEVTVPDGQLFLLGDNLNNSDDSRSWGCLPADQVRGRVEYVWWPPARAGLQVSRPR